MTDITKPIRIPYVYWKQMRYFIPLARHPEFKGKIYISELEESPEQVSLRTKDIGIPKSISLGN